MASTNRDRRFESISEPLLGFFFEFLDFFWGKGAPAWMMRSVDFGSSKKAHNNSIRTVYVCGWEERASRVGHFEDWGTMQPRQKPPWIPPRQQTRKGLSGRA